MANKKEEVVTTTTKVANGEKTVTTVTTTTETTTTTRKKKSGWWSKLSTLMKVLVIAGAVLLVGLIVGLLVLGRVKATSNTMETSVFQGETVWFNRCKKPVQGDVLVFRHPEADTVVENMRDKNYYKMTRLYGNAWCNKSVDPVKYQPKKRRPIVLSRCFGLPGDVVTIKDNIVYVNNAAVQDPVSAKYAYLTVSTGHVGLDVLEPLGLNKAGMNSSSEDAETVISYFRNSIPSDCMAALYSMTEESANALSKSDIIRKIQKVSLPKEYFERTVFPYMESLHWNSSNFGPVLVPAKGKVLKLNTDILPFYRRCIEAYEGNKVDVKDGKIFINGDEATSYRFRRDYYFVLGDNRTSDDDSRYFGFLPANHIMGVAR